MEANLACDEVARRFLEKAGLVKWCINVVGRGDVYAMPDYRAAVHMAALLNKRIVSRDFEKFADICEFAVVVPFWMVCGDSDHRAALDNEVAGEWAKMTPGQRNIAHVDLTGALPASRGTSQPMRCPPGYIPK